MKLAASAWELKRLDARATRRFGIPALILMENAGIACEEEIRRHYPQARRFLILCGQGNNGGDGFVLARRFWNRGRKVAVFHFGSPRKTSPDASLNFKIIRKLRIPHVDFSKKNFRRRLLRNLKEADVVVDALFGIGLQREVREPYRGIIRAVNASGKTVVSVDVPSGIHADSGRVLGEAIRADLCVTFVRPKLGFGKARSQTGRVVVRDISVPS